MINGLSGMLGSTDMARLILQSQAKRPEFETLDSSGNGSLDKSEFQSFFEGAPHSGAAQHLDMIFSKVDADDSNSIDKDEMEAAGHEFKARIMRGMMAEKPPTAGQLGSNDSLRAALDIFSDEEDKDAESILGSMDLNGDGTIDSDEIKLGIENLMTDLFQRSYEIFSRNDQSGSESVDFIG